MKNSLHCSRFLIPLAFLLCSYTHIPLHAKNRSLSLSESELHEVTSNTNATYIYLGGQLSSLASTIAAISALDMNQDSLTHALKRHIEQGFTIGLYDAVLDALAQARHVLKQKHSKAKSDMVKQLKKELTVVVKKVLEGELTITPDTIRNEQFTKDNDHIEKLSEQPQEPIKRSRTQVVDDNLTVKGNLKVDKHTHCKDELHVDKKLKLKDSIHIGHSIYMHNSKNRKVGTVFKHDHRFIHNFGKGNTFVGIDAGNFKMEGRDNSGFGSHALTDNKKGQNNTAVGAHTLTFNTCGSMNVAVGSRALTSNLAGKDNVAVGADTLRVNQVGDGNTAIGNKALENNCGKNNCAFGRLALTSNRTGDGNTAVGSFSLQLNKTGQYNTAVGEQSQYSLSSGEQNVSIGSRSLYSNTAAVDNVAIGSHTLYTNQANGNVAVGNRVLFSNITGDSNSAVGRNVLINNSVGDSNTAIGAYALEQNTTGRTNTALGKEALRNNISGQENIGIGLRAGINLISGNNNIYINNLGVANEHNAIRIGREGKQNKCFIQGIDTNTFGSAQADVQVQVGTGKLGIFTSSAEYKENIQTLPTIDTKKIYDLHPVSFTYKNDESHQRQIGLLAEEVHKIYPEIVVYDLEGKPFSICYKLLSVLLLGEMQEMNKVITTLLEKNEHLEQLTAELATHIKALKKK